ncbi:MAG TPA: HNH endonuclease [Stellaceae bacterium]|nr:HNH endonuclease [Stellaceae bacterium]
MQAPPGETSRPEDPPGFVVRTEAQKAAFDNGFRIEEGAAAGWLRFRSTTAHGRIWIAGAGASGPWFLSIDHAGVAAEMADWPAETTAGPGVRTWRFPALPPLYAALDRIYRLGVSLPAAPLARFEAKAAGLPRATEAERLVVQRVGQDIFRDALLDYWEGRCPLTGITERPLLRASHIVRWADCTSDAQRLDVHNGLLLSALWDAAFDEGLVTFDDDGLAIASPSLGSIARAALGLAAPARLDGLRDEHRANLAWHRANVFRKSEP